MANFRSSSSPVERRERERELKLTLTLPSAVQCGAARVAQFQGIFLEVYKDHQWTTRLVFIFWEIYKIY